MIGILFLFAAPQEDSGTGNTHFPPRVLRAIAPPYDEATRAVGVQGRAVFEVTVLPSGAVGTIALSLPVANQAFERVLETYAASWLFEEGEGLRRAEIVFVLKLVPHGSDEPLGTVFVAPSTMEIRAEAPPPMRKIP
jgi:hypothetical protein